MGQEDNRVMKESGSSGPPNDMPPSSGQSARSDLGLGADAIRTGAPGERDTELSRSHLENGQEPENHVCQHLALCGFPGIPDSENMLESCLIHCAYMEVEVGVTQAKPRLP